MDRLFKVSLFLLAVLGTTPSSSLFAQGPVSAAQKGTAPTAYKIAIFPFDGTGCVGRNRPADEKFAAQLGALITRNGSMKLAYSYYDSSLNHPPIKNLRRLWKGSKPNLTQVVSAGETHGVDAIVMYWRPTSSPGIPYCEGRMPPFPIEVYVIDVKQRKMHRLKGVEKNISGMAENALSKFLASKPKVAAMAQRGHDQAKNIQQDAASREPRERITFPAGGSVQAIKAAAEAYCGTLNKRSRLIAAPPENPEYVFECYRSTQVVQKTTPPTTLAKAAPAVQQDVVPVDEPKKIVIFPIGDNSKACMDGWTRPTHKQVVSTLRRVIQRDSALKFLYVYRPKSSREERKLWGAAEQPNTELVSQLGRGRGADAVLMAYRFAELNVGNCEKHIPPWPIKLHLVDMQSGRTFSVEGAEAQVTKLTEKVLAQYLKEAPATLAKAAPAVRKDTTTAPYKIAILQASGCFINDGSAGCGPAGETETAQTLAARINQDPALVLAYSYYDKTRNRPPVSKASRLWTGSEVRKKPNLKTVYALAKERNWDGIFMYWGNGDFIGGNYPASHVPVEFYMIDVAQRQIRTYKGMTDTVEKVAEQALSKYLASAKPKVVATAPAPVTRPSPPTRAATPPALTMRAPVATAPGRVTLSAGTSVPVELMESVNSELNQVGDTVALRVTEDFYVDDRLVIQKGAPVEATIGRSEERGAVGKSGSLALHPVKLRTADGQWAALHQYEFKGESKDASGRVAGAIIAFGIWGLLAQGNAATVLHGTRYQVVIAQNIVIDTAAVQPLPTVGRPAFRANAEFKKVSRVKFSKGKRGKDIVLEIALTSDLAKHVLPSTSAIRIVRMGTYVLPQPIYPINVERDDKHHVLKATFDWWSVIKHSSPDEFEDTETPVIVELALPDGRVGAASAGLHANWKLD
jgi:hypothetical protein